MTESHVLFTVDDQKFTHLDMTAAEVAKVEQKLGIDWVEFRPIANMGHRLALFEALLARSDPEHAAERAGAMTLAEIEAAVEFVPGQDDLPDAFEDGLPLGDKAAP